MNKFFFSTLYTIALILFSQVQLQAEEQNCGGLNFKGLLGCLERSKQQVHLAVTNADENVSLALIKNKEVVFQERGLGYVTQSFKVSGKKVEFAWHVFNVKQSDYFLIRTRGDNTSMIYVYKFEDDKLKDVIVTKGIHTTNPYITTSFSSEVDVLADTINVSDAFFEASFMINGDHLNNTRFIKK